MGIEVQDGRGRCDALIPLRPGKMLIIAVGFLLFGPVWNQAATLLSHTDDCRPAVVDLSVEVSCVGQCSAKMFGQGSIGATVWVLVLDLLNLSSLAEQWSVISVFKDLHGALAK